MNILKTIIIVFLVLVLVAGGTLYYFIKNFDINQYRAQLIEKIKEATGKDVNFKKIGLALSFPQGFALSVNDVSYSDVLPDGRLRLAVNAILLKVDISSFLKTKEIFVSHILVQEPFIEFEMVKAHELPTESSDVLQEDQGSSRTAETHGSQTDAIIKIEEIKVTDGTVQIIQKSGNRQDVLPIKDIDLLIKDFTFNKPFVILLDCSLLSRAKNIQVKGQARVDDGNHKTEFSDFVFHSDLSQYSLESIKERWPELSDILTRASLQGNIQANLKRLVLGPQGVESLYTEINLPDGSFKSQKFPFAFDAIRLNVKATESQIDILEGYTTFSSGSITMRGVVSDYQTIPRHNVSVRMSDISLREIIRSFVKNIDFEGIFRASLDVAGEGLPGNEGGSTLGGEGRADISGGKLRGINVLKEILDKLTMIPGLAENLNQNLPEKYKSQLNKKDTEFQKIGMDIRAETDRLVFPQLELVSDAFAIAGKGALDWNQTLELSLALVIPEDLSASMIGASQELNVFKDSYGRISIPFRSYRGPLDRYVPVPDVELLFKKAVQQKGKDELKKLLNKALGRDDEEQPPAQQPQEEKPAKKTSPEEQLIEDIFDTIFK